MGRWSNSRNGNLRYSVNRENNSGIYLGPTRGLSSPKNNRRGCLCIETDTYDVKCCNGALLEQGIGQIQVGYVTRGAFSTAFGNSFDNGHTI